MRHIPPQVMFKKGEEFDQNMASWEDWLSRLYSGSDQKKAAQVSKYGAMGYNVRQIEYIQNGPVDGKYCDERTYLCWFWGKDRPKEYRVHRITREMDVLHGYLADVDQSRVPLNTTACAKFPDLSARLEKIYAKFRRLTNGKTWYDNY